MSVRDIDLMILATLVSLGGFMESLGVTGPLVEGPKITDKPKHRSPLGG